MANSPTYVLHLIAAALLSHKFTRHIYFISIIYLYRFYTRIVYAQGIYIYIHSIYHYVVLTRHMSLQDCHSTYWMRVVGAKNAEKKIKQLDDDTQAC